MAGQLANKSNDSGFCFFAVGQASLVRPVALVQRKSVPESADFRNNGHFPNDDAATKLIGLTLRNLTAR